MSIFDSIGRSPAGADAAAKPTGERTFSFSALPESPAALQSLPEAALTSPFDTAALTVLALCAYAAAPETGKEMLNFLKGPQPLSPYQEQFLRDRFRDKTYVPFSYFAGATPSNDYTPATPFTLTFRTTPYSYRDEGYCTLYIRSSGADSERSVQLRQKDGKWYLWEQFLLSDIRTPASKDPWA